MFDAAAPMSACPTCSRSFRCEILERHAALCLKQAEAAAAREAAAVLLDHKCAAKKTAAREARIAKKRAREARAAKFKAFRAQKLAAAAAAGATPGAVVPEPTVAA